MEKLRDPIADYRDAVLTAAAEAITKVMTPEAMHECAKAILTKVIEEVSGRPYGALNGLVTSSVEVIMKEYIATPAVQQQFRVVVEKAVNDALESMPGAVRGKISDIALAGLVRALTPERRY